MLIPIAPSQYLSQEDFSNLKTTSTPFTLIDVRTEEAFAECHIPGAINQCVYDVQFESHIRESVSDPKQLIILYGNGEPYKAAESAFAKLKQAPFSNIKILKGGLKHFNGPTNGKLTPIAPLSKDLHLAPSESNLQWIGRNLTNQHFGKVALQYGSLTLDSNQEPKDAEVIVNMQQITCDDLVDHQLAQALINHLSDADFFETRKYPTASIHLNHFAPIKDSHPGAPNFTAKGTITIRGIQRPIQLKLLVARRDLAFHIQTEILIDRTAHGAIYGSGKWFEQLGKHLVNDHFHLHAQLVFE